MTDNNSIWNKHKELILGAIIFPFTGFLITLVVSNIAQSQFVWKTVVCLLGIIALVIFSSLFIVYLMHKKEQDKKDIGCLRAMEMLKSYKANLTHDSLITYEDFKRLEQDVQANEEIRIFTAEFKLDEDEEFQKSVILPNFREGVKYIYFIPDNPEIKNRFKNIAKIWQKKIPTIADQSNPLLEVYLVHPSFVFMTIVIYNANKASKDVIVKFPSGTFPIAKYPFIFKLAPDDSSNKNNIYNALDAYKKPESKFDLWN
jgi:hypothetical protein